MTILIHPARAADYDAVLQLNESAVPNVNSIPESTLKNLHGECCFFHVARESSDIAGFLLALPESASYDSLNFQYFKSRYPRFVYVDRIVINKEYRRRGVGRKLYDDLFNQVRPDNLMVTCEVNLSPPNPGSLMFHESLGFREVDQLESPGSGKRVSLQVRPPIPF